LKIDMLPPVDPAVLSANPRFNALYTDLCNNKLDPDGASRYDAKAQKEHDELSKVRCTTTDVPRNNVPTLTFVTGAS